MIKHETRAGSNPALTIKNKIMWDIVVIKKDGDNYIVMTPNGDVHCISTETFQTFERNGRVSYDPQHKKM